jgi:hypothetical protein
MEPANYYLTTIINAFKNLGPYALFFVGGYLIFIKMPFLFLKKSMDDQKKSLEDKKNSSAQIPEEKKSKLDSHSFNEESKRNNKTNKSSQKQQKTKAPPKKPVNEPVLSPEEILGFRPNESISKAELKKRYFELLKKNHPDRVASMGEDFKKLAEKNTKEINKAFERLKNKAA